MCCLNFFFFFFFFLHTHALGQLRWRIITHVPATSTELLTIAKTNDFLVRFPLARRHFVNS